MAQNKSSLDKNNKLNEFIGACRVCMSRSDAVKSLFHPDSNFIEEIEFCTGILLTKNDNLPSSICLNCEMKLTVAYKFKTTCISSEDSFRRLLEDLIKTEVKCEESKSDEPCLKMEYNCDDENNDGEYFVEGPKDTEVVNEVPSKTKKIYHRPTKGKFRKLYCLTCNIHFKCRKDSLEHQEIFHKEDQQWVCEVCGKVYLTYTSHYSHMRSHKKPMHTCAHCDYGCVYKSDLIKHIRIHTGEKGYQCHLCPNTYRTSSALRAHEQCSHTRVKSHACDQCGRQFYDKQKLRRHTDTHFNIKRHECEVCHSCFSRRCQWKLHLQRQHNVLTPKTRPGRQKIDQVIQQNIPSLFYK